MYKIVNRFATRCTKCRKRIAPRAGYAVKIGRRWIGECANCNTSEALNPCAADRDHPLLVTRFNSGAVVYQNRGGRCEDAPCCGCCS